MKHYHRIAIIAGLLFSMATPGNAEQSTFTVTPLAQIEGYYPPANESIDFIMGRFSGAEHPNFVKLSDPYVSHKNMYLQRQAYDAFKAMHRAAKKEGVRLIIRSATRSFSAQRAIWESKWTGKRKVNGTLNIHKKVPDPLQRARKILEHSSMPGSSRHHWGTEIDLNAFDNEWFDSGKGKKLYKWLEKNAARFGFCQPYTAKSSDGRRTGYNEEKWHWSYSPLSGPYTEQVARQLHNGMIKGFKGEETVSDVYVVEEYLLSINPQCLMKKPNREQIAAISPQ